MGAVQFSLGFLCYWCIPPKQLGTQKWDKTMLQIRPDIEVMEATTEIDTLHDEWKAKLLARKWEMFLHLGSAWLFIFSQNTRRKEAETEGKN